MKEIPQEIIPYLATGETLWEQPQKRPDEDTYREDYPHGMFDPGPQEQREPEKPRHRVAVEILEPQGRNRGSHRSHVFAMLMAPYGLHGTPTPRAYLVSVTDNGTTKSWLTTDITEAAAAAKVFWTELA